MPGLLEGVKVLDLTHYIAGPYCTKLLSGLGADVIKIERLGEGDGVRWLGPYSSGSEIPSGGNAPEDGAWFLYLNTAKQSVALDLKSTEGRRVALELAAKADILVENFAPGGMDGLGLSYRELQLANPALVVTSISNFGQTGPYRDWKASELNLYALGGLMNITGETEQEPLKEGMPLAQLGAGQNAFAATMAALMYAEETGEGQQIDLAIAEYATNILENALM
ncbi:MAG: CoA transferase, partial [Chloroflexota bacterium]|nr:CoA transferase [Chloroflexota bacterium]